MKIDKEKYGIINGHNEWDLAYDWFVMSNDGFYNKYGFSFIPTGQLHDEVKHYLSELEA